ncbi:MAG: hypothetical protein J5826_04920 [Bacteroidales bacterium]|nr:hypothetical protein [Bacteroidales bacterium]
MKNIKFSFKRFASFFNWYATVNSKKTAKIYLGIALAALVLVLVTFWNNPPADNSIYKAIFLVTAGVVASMCLADINKPTVRQQFLSMPASNLEKYLAVVSLTAARTSYIILALWLVESLRSLIQGSPMIITANTDINMAQYTSVLMFYWSINILLGVNIRKYPFVYGCIAGAPFAIAAFGYAFKLFRSDVGDTPYVYITHMPLIVAIIVLVAALVVGYFHFKRITLHSIFSQKNEL